tara:strand:+ start:1248 stop:1391 length:144 start_codon:yes stop_codon:yes gene_type:complete
MKKFVDFAIFRNKKPEEVALIFEELERIKRVSECRIYPIKRKKQEEQ